MKRAGPPQAAERGARLPGHRQAGHEAQRRAAAHHRGPGDATRCARTGSCCGASPPPTFPWPGSTACSERMTIPLARACSSLTRPFRPGASRTPRGWRRLRSRARCRTPAALRTFVEGVLWQAGHGGLPFLRARLRRRSRHGSGWTRWCDAFLSNHVANRASRTQGRALVATAARIFPEEALQPPARGRRARAPCWPTTRPCSASRCACSPCRWSRRRSSSFTWRCAG